MQKVYRPQNIKEIYRQQHRRYRQQYRSYRQQNRRYTENSTGDICTDNNTCRKYTKNNNTYRRYTDTNVGDIDNTTGYIQTTIQDIYRQQYIQEIYRQHCRSYRQQVYRRYTTIQENTIIQEI